MPASEGLGVDCVHLLISLLKEPGAIDGWQFPDYTMDGGDHRDTSQLLDWLDARPRLSTCRQENPFKPETCSASAWAECRITSGYSSPATASSTPFATAA
ncbi:MAG: hypothetical protein JXQ71_10060 [Verrucomicrobia bacterium]|nr:hypothetical protein [Verrucomicrobiota bacterium]